MNRQELDQLCVNTLRFLAVDMVEEAHSGHPGLPLGAAPMAYVLWTRYLKHNPEDPQFWDRDRFVLSAGHGSALLYALLHLTGYPLALSELRRFRRWGSRTPGHPESHLTIGVEASTGPLGQGLGNSLGMAIGEAHLRARFNRPGHDVVSHYTYVLASDGDLMEGVSSEASSLAGHLQLGRLIVLYDSNHVTLSGSTGIAFTEDVAARYRAYGWNVGTVKDGNDLDEIDRAIARAREVGDRPSLIVVDTIIGYGAPDKQGTFNVHGSPLGKEETLHTKQHLGWPTTPTFYIPTEARDHFLTARERGQMFEEGYWRRFDSYEKEYPELGRELRRRFAGEMPEKWDVRLPEFPPDETGLATRKASEKVLQEVARTVPELVGGSGDLDPSTFTWLKEDGDFEAPARPHKDVQGCVGGGWGYGGRNVHFGVREHAMGAAVNGLAYHGGFVPFGATFLVFSDYMRPALRLSAVAELHCIWVFSHDSIGVGEDGPSHQPVEQLAALRAIPRVVVIRPADANETRWAWQVAIEERHRPVVLALSRQAVPTLDRTCFASAELLRRGGYVLNPQDATDEPDLILLASGSEVGLIVAAEALLAQAGVRARLVSLPSWQLFEDQDPGYRESVLPSNVTARLAVEAASSFGWERYTGTEGATLTVDRFGASAAGERVLSEFGFTPEHVVERALSLLERRGR